jgi:hypothetical protein
MNHKSRTAVLCALLVVGAAAAGVALRGQNRPDERPQERADKVQEGQMTDKQRQHSKLFKHSGAPLREIAAKQNGDIEVEEGLGLITRLPTTSSQRPIFLSAICNADAVLVGTLTDKSSQLTDEGNFIFTDYQVNVSEIIKDNLTARIKVGDVITGTRDGGAIELNGRIFRAHREDFAPPSIGQRYLLFLRFIPATGAYLMYGNGTFEMDGQRVIALGPEARDELARENINASSAFLGKIRSFANVDCK